MINYSSAIISFVVCLCLVPLLRPLALRYGLTDHPSDRKHHHGQIPLCGGIAIFLASISVWLLTATQLTPLKMAFFMAGSLLLLLGLLDDLWELSSRWRLVFQAAAALLLVYVGDTSLVYFGDLLGNGQPVYLNGIWSTLATVFCVIGVINATNMIDGLDGLAGGMVLIALFWFLLIATDLADKSVASIILLFIGAVAGFLIYNLRYPGHRKASVFMGDAGSTLLGLLLAFLAIRLTQGQGLGHGHVHPQQHLPPMNAVWMLGLPLLDTLSLMLRRVLKGRSPFSADRDHLHHILLRAGFSIEQTVWILFAISAAFGAIAYFAWRQSVPESVLFYTAWGVFFVYVFFQKHAWQLMRRIKGRGSDSKS